MQEQEGELLNEVPAAPIELDDEPSHDDLHAEPRVVDEEPLLHAPPQTVNEQPPIVEPAAVQEMEGDLSNEGAVWECHPSDHPYEPPLPPEWGPPGWPSSAGRWLAAHPAWRWQVSLRARSPQSPPRCR